MSNRNGLDRAGLERLSTAELERLLLEDFHSHEKGEAGMGELYQAAQVLAERNRVSGSAADRAWERFEKIRLPLVEDGTCFGEDGGTPSSDAAQGRRHSPCRRWGRLAVFAALAAAALLSLSVASAASGGNLRGLLALWTGERMWLAPGQVVPVEEDDIRIPEEEREYDSLQEALEDYGLVRPVAPRWLPEGFALSSLEIEGSPELGHLMFAACYQRGEDVLVTFVGVYFDMGSDSSSTEFQKDEGNPIPYEAGGVVHMLATNAGRPTAVWANGPAECALSGDITMEELERIIDSIYEK